MKTDRRGLAVTTDSEDAIRAIDHFASEIVGLGQDAGAVVKAAEAHPDCAMLQTYAASMHVYSQSPSEALGAKPWLTRARERWDRLTERERLFIDAIDAGCEGDFARALSQYERIVTQWPRDMVAAKVAEFHFFEIGDAERQLRFMQSIAQANRDTSHVLAMYAFALELCARREEAEEVARQALALDPRTMWAQHCLAHVYAGQSRIGEGIAVMENYAGDWTGFGQYIQSHNWFHLATLYLSDLRFERVRDAYRGHVWGFTPELVVEHTDAILLLWYVELAGGEVSGGEWREIATRIRSNAGEHLFPFLNALYLYALSRAGEREAVDRELASLQAFAGRQSGDQALVWQEIGLPLVKGSVAYARGQWASAAELLGPILPRVHRAGGSDEQRAVFIQSHLMGLIKSGQRNGALDALRGYIGDRPITRLEQRWLDQI